MYKIDKTKVALVRGDSLILKINIKAGEDDYIPQQEDTVKFFLRNAELKKDQTEYIEKEPVLEKIIPNETLILKLDQADTFDLPFGRYNYGIQLITEDDLIDTFIYDIFDIEPNAESLMVNGIFTPTENKVVGRLSIFSDGES